MILQPGLPGPGIRGDRITNQRIDPIVEAMNPLRQQMITAIVVRAFFDSILAAKLEDRAAAGEFLSETLPAELVEVEYARAAGP
jgi:hypothetical protein